MDPSQKLYGSPMIVIWLIVSICLRDCNDTSLLTLQYLKMMGSEVSTQVLKSFQKIAIKSEENAVTCSQIILIKLKFVWFSSASNFQLLFSRSNSEIFVNLLQVCINYSLIFSQVTLFFIIILTIYLKIY